MSIASRKDNDFQDGFIEFDKGIYFFPPTFFSLDLRSSDYPAFCFILAIQRRYDAVGELSDLAPLSLVAKPLTVLVNIGNWSYTREI